MSFAAPLALLALILIPLAVGGYLLAERRKRSAAAAFVQPHMRESVVRWAPGWRRHLPMALFALALAVLIVGVARPQATVAVPVKRANIMLVTDESSSMTSTDVSPTRLEAAHAAALRFLDHVPAGVHVGAIGFTRHPRLLISPTGDRQQVRDALRGLQAGGSTGTGDALAQALQVLRRAPRPGAQRVPGAVVLLSDGVPTSGGPVEPVAQRARRLHIPVFTVILGTPQGKARIHGRIQNVPPDDRTMQRIADVTRARMYTATSAGELKSVYDNLATQVSKRDQERELTAFMVAAALLVMLAAAAFSTRWFARPV